MRPEVWSAATQSARAASTMCSFAPVPTFCRWMWQSQLKGDGTSVELGNGPAYVRRSVTNPAVGRTSPYSWWAGKGRSRSGKMWVWGRSR